MLYTFKLSRATGTTALHSFTLGKQINFTKMTLKYVIVDNPIPVAGDFFMEESADLPLYLGCSVFDNNHVMFNNGFQDTINDTQLIPIVNVNAGFPAISANMMNMPIIDEYTSWDATQEISFGVYYIDPTGKIATPLPEDVAYGAETNADEDAYTHRGISIVIEFDLAKDEHNWNTSESLYEDSGDTIEFDP